MAVQDASTMESTLQRAKNAFYTMATLTTEQKNQALEAFAAIIESHADFLLAENSKDLALAGQEQIAASLHQRLKLDAGKIKQLVQGIRDLVKLPDPAGRVLACTRLDDGLVLEKLTVPLGVIGIIFESRPDVIPQILSLILKSGNAVALKGGREAVQSNAAFMSLVDKLNQQCPWLPTDWATLLNSREAVQAMLNYPQYVDLIIPRGSNQLVQTIMASTSIPVLGHADGVCHMYIHADADLASSVKLVIDAKGQYPAACNALETLLVNAAVAEVFLPNLAKKASQANFTLKGCKRTQTILKDTEAVDDADWHTEYGDLTLAIKIVDSPELAIEHINRYGSHHTDSIVARDAAVIERFLNAVDSACVFANASTRFADGFRFGLGAEIGISTAKTHARGPVGLEGLVIYKYKLRGAGQIVADYAGENARPFLHTPCTPE
ncbi:MAG TPA: glutamate-5-semialdehyde dehydrogenase [Coleofasciculaceae cyanobacterium]|jgi:glutamate-5-semialdehyde dehydrogenase